MRGRNPSAAPAPALDEQRDAILAEIAARSSTDPVE